MKKVGVAIIGAGPYGLSLAAHLAARNVEHRIFGQPMSFWSQIAGAGGERYLKSYCFGTNISSPGRGSSFADYSKPRGLETFEPCSMEQFAAYGLWFQAKNVPWVEPSDATNVCRVADKFEVTLTSGEHLIASHLVLATGLSFFAHIPSVFASLPASLLTHTSMVKAFAPFRGRSVAVVGGGQSALEAAALLHEAGAETQLLVRENFILWNKRVSRQRSLWQKLRSPISGLGTGPKAWMLTHLPGATHHLPPAWRIPFVKNHLPPEGAWWLRERVESRLPVHLGTTVVEAREKGGRVALKLSNTRDRTEHCGTVDHIVAGSGYDIDVDHLSYLDVNLRSCVERQAGAPKLNCKFESSVPGLRFIGPASAMSFGPLFRFVVGAKYTAQVVSSHLASQSSSLA